MPTTSSTTRRPRATRLALGVTGAATLLFAAACGSDDGGGSSSSSSSSPTAEAGASSAAKAPAATAHVADDQGGDVGTVTFTPEGGAVEVSADVHGLKPGFYGFHIHQTGKCEAHDHANMGEQKPFTSAGGHFNPDNTSHPDHAGDMPSLLVTKNGDGHLSFTTDRFTVDQLTEGEGTAVMIHAGADNFANIPEHYAPHPDEETLKTGDAGARAGCGVVQK